MPGSLIPSSCRPARNISPDGIFNFHPTRKRRSSKLQKTVVITSDVINYTGKPIC